MVGVPGRSKGCNTCRKRKVKCDAEKPFCSRCRNSGRQCEGYETYPVFMIHTQEGRQRRSRLDDLKPLDISLPNTPPEIESDFEPEIHQGQDFSAEWSAQIVELFWSSVGTQGSESLNDIGQVWMREAFRMVDSSVALKYAVNALCVTRVAFMRGDETLANHGRHFYGLALKSLQAALYHPQLMLEDATLGAARILMLYEYFESSSNDPSAWMQHLEGFCLLVKTRGPERHRSTFSRALLEDARDAIMNRALMQRKGSFFGTKEWLTKPWEGVDKPVRQQVNDIGFAIAALFEMYDKSANPPGEARINDLFMYLRQALQLSQQVDQLDLEHANAITLPDTVVYIGVESALSSMNAWSLKISLRLMVGPLCNLLEEQYKKDRTAQENSAIGNDISQLVTTVKAQLNHTVCMQVCRRILVSLRFCFASQLGVNGGRRLLFPLSAAHYYLASAKAPEVRESQEMFNLITTNKGVGMACHIGKGVNPDFDSNNDLGSTGLLSGPGGSIASSGPVSQMMLPSLPEFINMSSQDMSGKR